MKKISSILSISAISILLTVDVAYFCSNSSVLSHLNASSSSNSSSPVSTSSNTNTSSSSIPTILWKIITRAGKEAGKWLIKYTVTEGLEYILSAEQQSHQKWVYGQHIISEIIFPDGTKKYNYGQHRTCEEFSGKGTSNCETLGKYEELPQKETT